MGLYYFEDLENASEVGDNWLRHNGGGFATLSADNSHSGFNAFYLRGNSSSSIPNADTFSDNNAWMQLEGTDISLYRLLEFWMYMHGLDNSGDYVDFLDIDFYYSSTDWWDNGYYSIESEYHDKQDEWIKVSKLIPKSGSEYPSKFRFRANFTSAYEYVYIDDIKLLSGPPFDGNFFISGCSDSHNYILAWCNRWDVSNYSITLETFLDKNAKDALLESTVPGAVRELYNILGTPKYIDTTYNSSNTLLLIPSGSLASLRNQAYIAVKSLSASPLKGPNEMFQIKIEGRRLDI